MPFFLSSLNFFQLFRKVYVCEERAFSPNPQVIKKKHHSRGACPVDNFYRFPSPLSFLEVLFLFSSAILIFPLFQVCQIRRIRYISQFSVFSVIFFFFYFSLFFRFGQISVSKLQSFFTLHHHLLSSQ